jgi:hypothetical protein
MDHTTSIIGIWEGVFVDKIILDGRESHYEIRLRLEFRKNGELLIKEDHLTDTKFSTERRYTYGFVDDDTIRIFGLEEDLRINMLAEDRMTLSLTPKDLSNESAPILTQVTFERKSKEKIDAVNP